MSIKSAALSAAIQHAIQPRIRQKVENGLLTKFPRPYLAVCEKKSEADLF